MLTIVVACAAMCVRDILGTILVIAEAKGRAVLAGAMDAAGDVAQLLTIVFGAGEVIIHGFTGFTILLLACMCATSFLTTMGATWWGRRIESA